MNNLRQYIDLLRKERQIVEINAPVSSDQEIAEIHRRVVAAGGPALLFNNVEGADFPCATNLFGTPQRVEMAFGHTTRALYKAAGANRPRLPNSIARQALEPSQHRSRSAARRN